MISAKQVARQEAHLRAVAEAEALNPEHDLPSPFIVALVEVEANWRDVGDRVRQGDENAIRSALAYLRVRPKYFRSGYTAEMLLCRVKQVPDLSKFESEVIRVVLGYCEDGRRRELLDVGKLAGRVWGDDLGGLLDVHRADALKSGRVEEVRAIDRVRGIALHWVASHA